MNLQPIYPISQHVMPQACTSCGGDVSCENGFADLDGERYKAYNCGRCASLALFPRPYVEAVTANQEKCRREVGGSLRWLS